MMQQDRVFTADDREIVNPCHSISINSAMDFVKNPVKCCERVQDLIQKLMNIVRTKKDDPKTKDATLYHGETWELMMRRWGKIEKDFCTKNKTFDISKIPDIYDCIKYDLQHNQHSLQFEQAEELYINAKYLADIVIPQEYGLTRNEKLTISQGICTPLLKKIRADLQRNIEEAGDETVNRLNPRYSYGVSSPGRHVRTRLYFTSESHLHSLLTVLRFGGLLDVTIDEQWRRAMEYVSMVSELNYMSQVVVMLYEDPTKEPLSEERFHVELHFSPGVNCCVQKNLPPGPGFRPHSRNDQSKHLSRIDQEDSTPDETPVQSDSSGGSDGSPFSCKKIDETPENQKPIPEMRNLVMSNPIPIRRTNDNSSQEMKLDLKLVLEEDQRSLSQSAQVKPLPLGPEHEPRSRSFDQTVASDKPDCCNDTPNLGSYFVSKDILCSENKKVLGGGFHSLGKSETDKSSFDFNFKKSEILSALTGSRSFFNTDFMRSKSIDLGNGASIRSKVSENILPIKTALKKAFRNFAPAKKTLPINKLASTVDTSILNSSWNKLDIRSLDLAHVEIYSHRSLGALNSFSPLGSIHNKAQICVKSENNQFENVSKAVSQKVDSSEPLNDLKSNTVKGSECTGIVSRYENPNSLSVKDSASSSKRERNSSPHLVRTPRIIFIKNKFLPQLTCQASFNDALSRANFCSCETKDYTYHVLDEAVHPQSRRTQSVSHCLDLTPSTDPAPRRHRHSISGQNYYRMSGLFHVHKRVNSTSSLFSTAVISGSSSAPNLRDMIPNSASVTAAIDGCGGVPPIRPLETLHNALSLRQLDTFLDRMTHALLYRTPISSPPKNKSNHAPPLQSPSSSMLWSGPPSFVSSSGPSSPNALSDFFQRTSGTDSADMSASMTSNEGNLMGPPDPNYYGHRDSIEASDFYSYPLQQLLQGNTGESGESTPVSVGSEKCAFEDFEPLISDTIDTTIIGDVAEEEKTLTAYMREEISRPRLAEIEWTKNDDPVQTSSQHRMCQCNKLNIETPSQAEGFTTNFMFDEDLPSFKSTLIDSTSERSRKKKSKFTITEGSLSAHFMAENQETFSQGGFDTKEKLKFVVGESGDGLQCFEPIGQAKFEVRKLSCEEAAFSSPKLKMFHSPDSHSTSSPDSSSPVLTLASSFKDSSSISRGFIVPDNSEPPKQP